jgi:hypothetical protein
LAATFAFVFPFFALRKFDQPLKSDIGDKTIFQYFKRVETGQLTEQVAFVFGVLSQWLITNIVSQTTRTLTFAFMTGQGGST